MPKAHLGRCIESAIISGDAGVQRNKAHELLDRASW